MIPKEHIQFRLKIPFLQQIPDDIYFNLCTEEWLFPINKIEEDRRKLEQEIGHYVMTYKAHVFRRDIPLHQHLCARLSGAELSEIELHILSSYGRGEKTGVNFVVYQKPLSYISPEQSPLAIAYKKHHHATHR